MDSRVHKAARDTTSVPGFRFLLAGYLAASLLHACVQGNSGPRSPADSTRVLPLPPKEVYGYVAKRFPGWSIPDTADYSPAWWSFYDRGSLPYYAVADLDDDGLADHALILKNRDSLCLAVLTVRRGSFSAWRSPSFGPATPRQLHYGLSVEPPGRIDIALPALRSLILKRNAINLSDYEQRIAIYHRTENTFTEFKTR